MDEETKNQDGFRLAPRDISVQANDFPTEEWPRAISTGYKCYLSYVEVKIRFSEFGRRRRFSTKAVAAN